MSRLCAHFHQATTTNIVTGLVGVGTILLASVLANAEVPPLKPEALRSEAHLVVTGVVRSIKTEDIGDPNSFQRRRYTITFEVESVEKSAAGSPKTIVVKGWELIKSPRGWVGPGGHYSTRGRLSALTAGSEVRFYLLQGAAGGQFDIVLPNGFEILKKETK